MLQQIYQRGWYSTKAEAIRYFIDEAMNCEQSQSAYHGEVYDAFSCLLSGSQTQPYRPTTNRNSAGGLKCFCAIILGIINFELLAPENRIPEGQFRAFLGYIQQCARLESGYPNADSSLRFGAQYMEGKNYYDYVGTIAHELMHKILQDSIGFLGIGRASLTCHEYVADTAKYAVMAFLANEIINSGSDLPAAHWVHDILYQNNGENIRALSQYGQEGHYLARSLIATQTRSHDVAFLSGRINARALTQNWTHRLNVIVSFFKQNVNVLQGRCSSTDNKFPHYNHP